MAQKKIPSNLERCWTP